MRENIKRFPFRFFHAVASPNAAENVKHALRTYCPSVYQRPRDVSCSRFNGSRQCEHLLAHSLSDVSLFTRYVLTPKDDRSTFRKRWSRVDTLHVGVGRVFGRRQAEINRAPRMFEDGRVVQKG
jgi:hypothetical protein